MMICRQLMANKGRVKKVEISTWGDVKPVPHFLSLKEYLQCILSCLSNFRLCFFHLRGQGWALFTHHFRGGGGGVSKSVEISTHFFNPFPNIQHRQMVTDKFRRTSFPYFGVKLICVCLMFAYRKNSLFTLRRPMFKLP